MASQDSAGGTFGLSHLGAHPITVTFGMTLLAVLIILVILRVLFAEVRVGR
jgi:hypothetical protein